MRDDQQDARGEPLPLDRPEPAPSPDPSPAPQPPPGGPDPGPMSRFDFLAPTPGVDRSP